MKKIGFIFICILSFFIINGLIHSIVNLWQKQSLIVTAQKELNQKRKENIQLKKQLTSVSTTQFVEEEARNDLFMGKPGEQVVIIPQSLLSPTPAPKKEESTHQSNWKKWLDLLISPSS